MKKVFLFLFCLVSSFFLFSCSSNKVLGYNELKSVAHSDFYGQMLIKDYKLGAKKIALSGYIDQIRCFTIISKDSKKALYNVCDDIIICENLNNEYCKFNNANVINSDTVFPEYMYNIYQDFVIYEEEYNNSQFLRVKSYDNRLIASYELNTKVNVYLRQEYNAKYEISIRDYISDTVVKTFNIESDNYKDYYLVSDDESNNQPSIVKNISDELTPLYDRKGKVYGYVLIHGREYDFDIFDKDKKFIASYNLSTYGFDDYIILEKKVVLYKNYVQTSEMLEEIYKDDIFNIKYNVTIYEIDLTNGKLTINEDYDYLILNNWVGDEKSYDGTIVKYYELNDDRSIKGCLKYAYMTDKFSFNKSYYVDKDLSNYAILKLNDDAILLLDKYGNDENKRYSYIVTKKETKVIPYYNIKICNDVVVIDNQFTCSLDDFIDGNFDNLQYRYYISKASYNGELIIIDHDEKNDKYYVNGRAIQNKYLDEAKRGFFVFENEINVGYSSFNVTKPIYSISTIFDGTMVMVYKIIYDDGSYTYIRTYAESNTELD